MRFLQEFFGRDGGVGEGEPFLQKGFPFPHTDQNMRIFIIKTLGCKVNQYDSELIREQLESRGLK